MVSLPEIVVSEEDDLEPLSPFKVTRGLAPYDNGELPLSTVGVGGILAWHFSRKALTALRMRILSPILVIPISFNVC